MRADGEAMRLVAQPLQEIQHRIARLEREGRLAGHEEALAAGVAVGPLAMPTMAMSSRPSSLSTWRATSSWPWPPSISNRSGQLVAALGILAQGRPKRRVSTSRIMAKSSPAAPSVLMLNLR